MSEQTTEQVVETQTETVVTEVAPVVEIPQHFKALEVENDEQFNERINHYKEVEKNWNEVQTKKSEIDSTFEILKTVEKEPNPEILALESLLEKGISRRTANEILDTTEDEFKANPLKTLMLAEAVKDPKFFAANKDDIEKSIREQYNLPEEGEYEPTAGMKLAALKAVEDINKIKSEVGEAKNPFTLAKTKFAEQASSFESGKKAAATELQAIVAGLTEVTDKQGDAVFTFKVSKEDRAMLESEIEGLSAAFIGSDKEAINKYVVERVRIQKYLSGEAFKEWENTRAADIEQQVTKRLLEGKPVTINRSTEDAKAGEMSPIMKAAIAAGKSTS